MKEINEFSVNVKMTRVDELKFLN